jgi:hypothetical protein
MIDSDDIDRMFAEATKKRMNWDEGSHYANWREYVSSQVRAIWYTLTDEQKVAIACDALVRARDAEEAAELRSQNCQRS